MQVEEDDDQFKLDPFTPGQPKNIFELNYLDVDETGAFIDEQPEIKEGRRQPTLYEVMEDDDFLPELRLNNESLIKL